MQEEDYIRRAQNDPNEFRLLYDLHYKNIFLFVYRRVDDEDTAADITSQVFLKAMQHLKNYKITGAPFGAWLYRIASNEVAQHFRDNKKVRTVSLEQNDLDDLLDDDSGFISEERNKALFDAIKKISPAELELIEMRFFEKRSFKEIGDIKEITENNAKVKVYRILDKLRNLISVEV